MENKKGFADKYFLEKIYLSGYKSIQQTEIELKSNFNIIIGKNGAGKTNFFHLLSKTINYNVDDIHTFKSVLNFSNSKDIEITSEKKIPEGSSWRKQFIVKNSLELVCSITINKITVNYSYYNFPDIVRVFQKDNFIVSSTFIKHGIPKDYHFVNQPSSVIINDDESSNFLNSETLSQYPFFVSSIFASLYFDNEYFGKKIEFNRIDLGELRKYLSILLNNQVGVIQQYLKQFSPINNIRFSDNFNIFINSENREIKITNLFLEFKVDGNWYPYSDLSDGTKRLFYIISEVAFPDFFFFQYKWFGKPKETSTRIILIEEPELGIHPHQFHNLMTFLKVQSQTKQIIITTHSPEALNILSADELDSIILSEYDTEKGTQLRHMTDKEKMDAKSYIKDMYLSDYWMHSNLEPAN